jgi:hypothetical protein
MIADVGYLKDGRLLFQEVEFAALPRAGETVIFYGEKYEYTYRVEEVIWHLSPPPERRIGGILQPDESSPVVKIGQCIERKPREIY